MQCWARRHRSASGWQTTTWNLDDRSCHRNILRQAWAGLRGAHENTHRRAQDASLLSCASCWMKNLTQPWTLITQTLIYSASWFDNPAQIPQVHHEPATSYEQWTFLDCHIGISLFLSLEQYTYQNSFFVYSMSTKLTYQLIIEFATSWWFTFGRVGYTV